MSEAIYGFTAHLGNWEVVQLRSREAFYRAQRVQLEIYSSYKDAYFVLKEELSMQENKARIELENCLNIRKRIEGKRDEYNRDMEETSIKESESRRAAREAEKDVECELCGGDCDKDE